MGKLEVVKPNTDPVSAAQAHMQVAAGYAEDAAREMTASMIACQALAESVCNLTAASARDREIGRRVAAFLARELQGRGS